MRRYRLFVAVFAFAFVTFTSVVLATDGTTVNTPRQEFKEKRIEVKQGFKDKKLEIKSELKEKEASRRAELKDKIKENVTKRLSMVNRNLNAYLLRLDKISGKIESRIKKLGEKGVNTSKAEAKLAEAKLLRDKAKVAIDKAASDSLAVADRATLDTALASIKEAKNALFIYHKGLVETLRELKAANALREGSKSVEEAGND